MSLYCKTLAVGPLQCNCSVLVDQSCKQAVVIDPGGDVERILQLLNHQSADLIAIVHTHAHLDHVGASFALQQHYPQARAWLHRDDQLLYEHLPLQAQFLRLPCPPKVEMFELTEQVPVVCGNYQLQVLHTPGHSPGSVSFYEPRHNLCFCGDTLFQRSIGRTDLWGGDQAQLHNSIRQKLYPLPESCLCVPGHGALTTIGNEKSGNPFCQA